MTLVNVSVRPPDHPIYNEATGNKGTGKTTRAKSRQSFDTIFTVDVEPLPPVVVEPLPFQTYEFEENRDYFVPVESGAHCFIPEICDLLLFLMNFICFSMYTHFKGESVNSYREGKLREARVNRLLAYVCAFVTIATPGAIALIIIKPGS